jgi:hypothetical protein
VSDALERPHSCTSSVAHAISISRAIRVATLAPPPSHADLLLASPSAALANGFAFGRHGLSNRTNRDRDRRHAAIQTIPNRSRTTSAQYGPELWWLHYRRRGDLKGYRQEVDAMSMHSICNNATFQKALLCFRP